MSVDERTIEDGFSFADDNVVSYSFVSLVEDFIALVSSSGVGQVFFDEIEEFFNLRYALICDGDDSDCIALSTSAFHPSIFTGFNFNSMTVFQDVLYAADSTGIYVFDSDTDDGVEFHTGVILPQTNFGSMSDKRIRGAFIDYTGGPISLSVSASKLGVSVTTELRELSGSKTFFSRNLRGKSFDIAISDFNVLSLAEFFCIILVR